MSQKKINGREAEALAARFLAEEGMVILERNYRCRQGEIDLVGSEDGYLVFIEVKARSSNACGYPGEAVTYQKQKKICRTAQYYCCQKRIAADRPVRFDVVELFPKQIRHIKNAFDYC
jgi:putative endonuclease